MTDLTQMLEDTIRRLARDEIGKVIDTGLIDEIVEQAIADHAFEAQVA